MPLSFSSEVFLACALARSGRTRAVFPHVAHNPAICAGTLCEEPLTSVDDFELVKRLPMGGV